MSNSRAARPVSIQVTDQLATELPSNASSRMGTSTANALRIQLAADLVVASAAHNTFATQLAAWSEHYIFLLATTSTRDQQSDLEAHVLCYSHAGY